METAFREFNQIDKMIGSAYHEAAVKYNLADSEFDILYILNSYMEGCNQSALYKESFRTKSTINSAIQKMEKKGILYLEPGTGKNTLVFLTEKGKKLMEEAIYPVIQIENEIHASWTKEEQEIFLKLNRDFAEKLQERIRKL